VWLMSTDERARHSMWCHSTPRATRMCSPQVEVLNSNKYHAVTVLTGNPAFTWYVSKIAMLVTAHLM